MEEKILVTGHLIPDTDSICSAIIYSWFLNKTGKISSPVRLGKINRETEFVLKKFGFSDPELFENFKTNQKIVIVDTNNPDELPKNLADLQILEIIDHHKLVGGISTKSPIFINIQPLACTASLIFQMAKQKDLEIPKNIAGLMLSAILSDTLKFSSPTTTELDIQFAKELEKITGADIDKLANEMFLAKSDLTGFSARDILFFDSKIYELKNKKFRMSTLETVKPEIAMNQISEIQKEMKKIKTEENLDGILFFITDIFKSNSILITNDSFEKDLTKKAFGKNFDDTDTMFLEGVVSRKKQIVPVIENAL